MQIKIPKVPTLNEIIRVFQGASPTFIKVYLAAFVFVLGFTFFMVYLWGGVHACEQAGLFLSVSDYGCHWNFEERNFELEEKLRHEGYSQEQIDGYLYDQIKNDANWTLPSIVES